VLLRSLGTPVSSVSSSRRVALAGALLATGLAAVVAAAWLTSPKPVALTERVDARLRAAHGKPVPLAAMAPLLRQAVVATEDERFYHHHGVDLIGLLRAIPYDLAHFSFAQGGSTITEQVAKLFYLRGNDHTLWRKLEDAVVAFELENRHTKQQILDAYLNGVYFGEGAYGADPASERYFGIPPRRLGGAQATLLAGLIQAPSAYDPYRHPGAARARQVDVVRALVRTGRLNDEEGAAVLDRPLRLRGGKMLPPLASVNLEPGPVFVWWQLALGVGTALLGLAALLASRASRYRAARAVIAVRVLSLGLALLGASTVIRAFRSA